MSSNSALFLAIALAMPCHAHAAHHGGEGGNGGNPNEMRFESVATNIQQWIESGNADALHLPPTVSLAQYKQKMLAALDAYQIEFTEDNLQVQDADKACKNFVADRGQEKIVCNGPAFSHFYESQIDDVYRLVHHELAGLAGIEVNSGAQSDYAISSQVTGFLEAELVRRLPIFSRGGEQNWLPAVGWRNFQSLDQPGVVLPLALDQGSPLSRDPELGAPWHTEVSLSERGIKIALRDGSPLLESAASNTLSVTAEQRNFSLGTVAERVPEHPVIPEFDYSCTLSETGETLAIAPGISPVAFPSQRAIPLTSGRILITPEVGSIFVTRFVPGATTGDLVKLTVRIPRGNQWAELRFPPRGAAATATIACEVPGMGPPQR